MAELNPALLNTSQDFNTDFNKAALQGVERQKTVGGLNALSGIDLNDPQSFQNALNNSAKTGNLEQANALINLNRANQIQQYALSKLTGQAQALPQQGSVNVGQDWSNGAPITTTAATPSLQMNGQNVDQKTALNHAAKINDEIDTLSSLPQEQRAAYASKVAPDLGFTPEQVAGADLSDTGLSTLKHHVNAVTDHLNGNIQNLPQELYTPQDVETMSLLSGDSDKMAKAYVTAHPDMIPVPGLAGVVMNPRTGERFRIASPQEVAGQAGMTAGAQKASEIGATNAGEMVTPYVNGSATPLPQMTRAEIAKYNADPANQAAGHFLTTEANPGAKSYATSAGGKAGENTGTIGSIVIHDNASGQDREYNGTQADLINDLHSGKIEQDSNGRYSVGKHATAQEVETTKADTDLMGKIRSDASDQEKRSQAQSQIDNSKTAIAALNNLKTDAMTPSAEKLANALNVLGVKAGTKEATDIATYKNLINTNTMSYIHQFPGRFTDRDATISKDASAGLTTPTDAAKFAFAKKAAEGQLGQDYRNYVIQHPEIQSAKELSKNFTDNEGQYSLYAQPIFQQTIIKQNGGHPIVTPFPVEKDGSQYGVLMLNKNKDSWQTIRLK